MRGAAVALGLLALLASCTTPPQEAYLRGSARSGTQVSVGVNTVGEACTQPADSTGGADVYCGTWLQPSARVREGGSAASADLRALAVDSPWRQALDTRFLCGPPAEGSILGGDKAVVLSCTRRLGGWPQVALVASVGGRVWYADGVLPVRPAMERSIGVLAGELHAEAAVPAAAGATRTAAGAFTASDVGDFDDLIDRGTRANLADDFVQSEAAFRRAVAVQEKALGHDNPNIATPLTYMALQVSNQGRYAEADAMFTRAQALAPRSADPSASARLLNYRALHENNQGHYDQALNLLAQAETAYAKNLPPEILHPRPISKQSNFGRTGRTNLADMLPDQQFYSDPITREALLGVIEVRRYRGVVLLRLGRTADSAAALQSASTLARDNGVTQPLITARLYRASGLTAAATGEATVALGDLDRSIGAFDRALPASKPLANTALLQAQERARTGDIAGALNSCRFAARVLEELKQGTDPNLIAGCLDIYAEAASRGGDDTQGILAEMFLLAQSAQGGVTSQQIAQATARLQENARDPRVGAAIRAREDALGALASLVRRRDDLLQGQDPAASGHAADVAALDKDIAAANAKIAETDEALQAASPNYGQLVQQAVPVAAVQHALRPDEAFVSMTLNAQGGWVFLVRRDRLAVAPIKGGQPRMAALVKQVRASIESDTDTVPKFDTADAHAIYADTIGGVADGLQDVKTLTVAPAGPLLSLPFELLLTGPVAGDDLGAAPWLIRKYTISHVPSATNFVSLRKIAGGSRGMQPWFGFGEFQPIPLAKAERSFSGPACAESARLFASLPALPFARVELEAGRQLLGAPVGNELLGAAFTAPAVLKTNLKDVRVLQFATHALLPAELKCQDEPAIVTSAPAGATDASGALLKASQVATMDLDADLIILSACNSGGPGGSTAGESLSGLARSFFYAGARSLMVTHWSVNDQTAAYLVADTLRRYHDHPDAGIAAAMRDAQLGMLDAAGKDLNAAVSHPFYWAPFTLIGEGSGSALPNG